MACLFGAFGAGFSLLLAGLIVSGAIYAGWNTGRATARANSAAATQSELKVQCQHISQDLVESNFQRAQGRFAELLKQQSSPACLIELAPTATAAYLLAQPSPTALPTQTATRPAPTATPPPPEASPTPAEDSNGWEYDLGALLAEAQADLEAREFTAAIDTLEAIIGIDGDFQREQVRGLALRALSAQALLLYRSGKLSEAIVLTDRAEVYGDIGELNYERYVAEQYLTGQRYKTTNPALAVLRFNEIYYQHNSNYMNGQVVGELQDALRYYGDALAFQGDACQARDQYAAALELYPTYSQVSRGELTTRQQQAALDCGAQPPTLGQNGNGQAGGTPQAIGVRTTADGRSG